MPIAGLDPSAYAEAALTRARAMKASDPSADLLNLRLILAIAQGDTDAAASLADRWNATAPQGYPLFQLRTAQLVIAARRNDSQAFAGALEAWKADRERFPQNWNDAALDAPEFGPFLSPPLVKPAPTLPARARGGASLAWQSDYGQFYLADAEAENWEAPVEFSDETMRRRWSQMSAGLVVYTNDSLSQILDIQIYDREPHWNVVEWRSKQAWTQVETCSASFPAGRFTVTSPSMGGVSSVGPFFKLGFSQAIVRIGWRESGCEADDAQDLIRIELWPATSEQGQS